MRIVHRIVASRSRVDLREVRALGVEPGASDGPLLVFTVGEDEVRWPEVRAWIARTEAVDFVYTTFTDEEIAGASWLALATDWHHGYPQPDDGSFGYREATYDVSGYCDQCGTGLRQVAPFQMKAEPKWGRKGILQMNWVFDELFVKRDVYQQCFQPFGIAARPVHGRRHTPLETVVQLVVDDYVDVCPDETTSQACDQCDRVKYLPHTRGPFPAAASSPPVAMVRTAQWFGSGASAHNEILVSQDVASALSDRRVRGATLQPVATTHSA